MKMNISDKETLVSAVSLHYTVLGSLTELEQLKRGLQTARFESLMENHACLLKPLFFPSNMTVTADFIQDLFIVQYSDLGSNNRSKEEAIMMN